MGSAGSSEEIWSRYPFPSPYYHTCDTKGAVPCIRLTQLGLSDNLGPVLNVDEGRCRSHHTPLAQEKRDIIRSMLLFLNNLLVVLTRITSGRLLQKYYTQTGPQKRLRVASTQVSSTRYLLRVVTTVVVTSVTIVPKSSRSDSAC